MTTSERRKAIIEALNVRRYEIIDNLAFEFGVSRRTIIYDIERLSFEYPIYTTKGTGGGVHVMDGAKLIVSSDKMNADQTELLHRLLKNLTWKDFDIMKSILKKYG